jgi:hypothetical protein
MEDLACGLFLGDDGALVLDNEGRKVKSRYARMLIKEERAYPAASRSKDQGKKERE